MTDTFLYHQVGKKGTAVFLHLLGCRPIQFSLEKNYLQQSQVNLIGSLQLYLLQYDADFMSLTEMCFLFNELFLLFGSGVWSVGGLEVSTGKVSSIEAMNGSTVLLPCTYSSCIGIKNLYFNWQYNDNGTFIKVQTCTHNFKY